MNNKIKNLSQEEKNQYIEMLSSMSIDLSNKRISFESYVEVLDKFIKNIIIVEELVEEELVEEELIK